MKGIYILTNRINGKCYVGKSADMPKRIHNHFLGRSRCRAMQSAIAKYGRDAFDVKMIAYPKASELALESIEKWHIAQHAAFENGYNLTGRRRRRYAF